MYQKSILRKKYFNLRKKRYYEIDKEFFSPLISFIKSNFKKKNIKKPVVVIGGVNNLNYKKLINNGAKYIAISSFIWDNPKLKPEVAIKEFK